MIIDLLSRYYGMTPDEFAHLINNDESKFYRFYYDYLYNHN